MLKTIKLSSINNKMINQKKPVNELTGFFNKPV